MMKTRFKNREDDYVYKILSGSLNERNHLKDLVVNGKTLTIIK
jgi:hypothetical protein